MQRVANGIKEENIDIVALNEVDQTFSKRSNYVDQGYWLAKELQMDFVFGPSLAFNGGYYGNAILSRLPITKYNNHIF